MRLSNIEFMKKINFGRIDRVILIGHGEIFPELVRVIQKYGFEVIAVTPEASLDEVELSDLALIKTADPKSEKNIRAVINENCLAVSYSSPWIFDDHFISKFEGKFVNIHESLLPIYRGGGGSSWGLMQDDDESGVTIHEMTPRIDAGKILLQKKIKFNASDVTPLSRDKLRHEVSIKLIDEFFLRILNEIDFDGTDQDDSISTYWPRLSTEENGFINWSWNLSEILNFIKAFEEPYLGASTYVNGRLVHLRRPDIEEEGKYFHPFLHGLVFRKHNEKLFIATKGGVLTISDVRSEEGLSSFHLIKLGDRLFTPSTQLDAAMSYRAVY